MSSLGEKVFELRVRRVHKTETPLGKGERKIFGVCRGLANYFDTDPTFVTILFVAAFFGFGMGLLAYVVMALIMPDK